MSRNLLEALRLPSFEVVVPWLVSYTPETQQMSQMVSCLHEVDILMAETDDKQAKQMNHRLSKVLNRQETGCYDRD